MEDFTHDRMKVTQDQTPPRSFDLLVQANERGHRLAGEVFHLGEVEEELTLAHFFGQLMKLLAGVTNGVPIEQFPTGEVDQGYIAEVFHFEVSGRRLSYHKHPASFDR